MDPEARRQVLLLFFDPEVKAQHHAYLSDVLSCFCCEAARVTAVLEGAEAL